MDIEDNTVVINMKRGFNEMMGTAYNRNAKGIKRKFGDSFMSKLEAADGESPSNSRHVSMRDIMEKSQEIELKAAKAKVSQLGVQLSQADVARQAQKIEYEKQLQELNLKYQRNKDKLMDVSRDLTTVTSREADYKRQLAESRAAAESSQSATERRVQKLQTEKYELQTQLTELSESSRNNISELKNAQLRLSTELQICRDELAASQEQLKLANGRCKKLSEQVRELEMVQHRAQKDSNRIQELEQQLSRLGEDLVHVQAMRSQLSQLPQLRAENRRLLEDNQYLKANEENVLLLKEQVRSLTGRADRVEERERQVAQLQSTIRDLEKKVADLSGKPEGLNMSTSQLCSQLAELQSNNALLLQQQAEYRASCKSESTRACQLEDKLKQQSQQSERVREERRNLEALNKRLQKKLLLVSKERDSYRGVIDSYESETTMNVDSMTSQRLHQLQQVNDSCHRQLAECEAEIQRLQGALSEAHRRLGQTGLSQSPVRVPVVDDKVALALREKVVSLEKTVEKLRKEKEILEMRLERNNMEGDYNPATTKVVNLLMNPLELARRRRALQVESLTEENQRLKEMIKLLEENGGHKIEDLTICVDQNVKEQPESSKALDEIRTQLSTAELKNKRLIEAFKKTSQEFREVVYELLGYRIDMPVQSQYKLMSTYAETPEDFFQFQQSNSGEMQLLETAFSASHMDKLKTYLQGAKSIPAFLASVTIDLLTKQTLINDSVF